jgi:hypothetical protein
MLLALCLRKEADYTLDDSFWNEDSPVGKQKNEMGLYESKRGGH